MGNVPCSTKSSHCPSGRKIKISYSDNDMKRNAKFIKGVGFIPVNAKPNKHRSFRLKKKWFKRYMLANAGDLFTNAADCNPIHLSMCDAIVHKTGGNGMEIKFQLSRKMRRILGVPIYPKLTTK